MTTTIRTADRRDVDALGRLGAMLLRAHYAFDQHRFLAPGDRAESGYGSFLRSMLESPDDVILVAARDDVVVGYVWAALEPMSWKELRGPAGFVHDLVVDEPARRGGVARALMDAAVAWLRERGAPRVVLWTAAPNDAARTLFSSLGFRETMIEMTREIEK